MNILVFLLGFFVFSQLGFHFWPEWSIVNGIRIDYLSPTLYCFDVIFLAIWSLNNITPRPPLNLRGGVRRTRVIFITFIVLNIFFALSPLNSIFKWLRLYECFWLFSFFYRNSKYSKPLLAGFSLGIILVGFLAVGQFIKGSSLGGVWYWMGERSFSLSTPGISKIYLEFGSALRPYATFPHPNVLAAVFLLTSILLLNTKNKIFKIVGILEWIIIFFTFSRSIIFLQIIILGFLFFKHKKRFLILLIPLIFLLFIAHPNSLNERAVQIKDFFNILSNNYLFGLGLGNSIFYQSKYFLQTQPIHNIYLLAISELGLLPVLFMFLLFTEKIKICLSTGNFWTKIFLLSVLASGTVDHYWWTLPQTQIVLSICFAFALKLGSEKN